MKKYQKILLLALVVTLVAPVMAVGVSKAEAACSYQGFINSGGKCSGSFNNTSDRSGTYRYDNERSVYDRRFNFTQTGNFNGFSYGGDVQYERIMMLLALLTQLQELRDQRDSFGFSTDDSMIDITTRSATNIDRDEAELRGTVDFNNSDTATVWFEYGKSINNLNTRTSKIELDDSDSGSFSKVIDDLDEDTRYYFRAVGEDEDGEIDRGTRLSFVSDDDGDGNNSDPDVVTENADDITEDSVELNGSVDMNDFRNGRVFFVYGEDESQVEDVEDDYDTYSEIDEDGDDLQKVSIATRVSGDRDYFLEIYGLDDDTDYYYSICVEYEDEDNDDVLVCGSVKDFTTDDSNSNNNPDNETDDADDITSTTARLNGTVDMNDFNNGTVFFVYGTDEDKIRDVEDDYDTYDEVDEDGDVLQKVKVDSDLDDEDSYSKVVTGLLPNTEYFASTCVEYEDDDNDDQLVCSSVRSFETD